MKRMILSVLIGGIILWCGAVFAQQQPPKVGQDGNTAPQGAYPTWFEAYQKKLAATMPVMTDEEKADLTADLKVKPAGGSAAVYRLWLKNGVEWFLRDTGAFATDQQFEKLSYIIAAAPDLTYTEGVFPEYMEFVQRETMQFLPILDDSKRKYLEYFKMAKPKSTTPSDFQLWYTKYSQVKKDVEQMDTDTQNEVLTFFKALQPEQQVSGSRKLEVTEETLLKIRSLVQSQQLSNAIKEIDTILSTP